MTGSSDNVVLVEGGSRALSYRLEGGERLHLVAFVFGGTLSVEVSLAAPRAEFELDGLFIGDASVSVVVRHQAPDCRSRQLVKGIVDGDAKGEFVGRIYVAPDAQRTDAEQQSRNIQLSDTATVVARPELEIYADDVKCSHGASVGQLDDEAIYYMRQRGIDEGDARRMQLEGFAFDIASRVGSESMRDSIADKIGRLLSR